MTFLSRKILQSAIKPEIPEAVDFNGATDYLIRNSDFVGNTDSKTFTFSCWFYIEDDFVNKVIYRAETSGIGDRFSVRIVNLGRLQISVSVSAVTKVAFTTPNNYLPVRTWNHILVSLNTDSSSFRYVYLNDKVLPVTWSNYDIGTNIPFDRDTHCIGRQPLSLSEYMNGRLNELYLDYTYRDLTIEANRRLFITEDLKPQDSLEILNPIVYFPLKTGDTAEENKGTGGDMIPQGNLTTSQRGPNQYNCVCCDFDGGDCGAEKE